MAVDDQLLHRIDDGRIGRLPENCELGLRIATV